MTLYRLFNDSSIYTTQRFFMNKEKAISELNNLKQRIRLNAMGGETLVDKPTSFKFIYGSEEKAISWKIDEIQTED